MPIAFLGRRSRTKTSSLYAVPVSLASSYLISPGNLNSDVYNPQSTVPHKNGKILQIRSISEMKSLTPYEISEVLTMSGSSFYISRTKKGLAGK